LLIVAPFSSDAVSTSDPSFQLPPSSLYAGNNTSMSQVSEQQKMILEQAFKDLSGTTPDGDRLSKLSVTAGLDTKEVKTWFVKKRKREKVIDPHAIPFLASGQD